MPQEANQTPDKTIVERVKAHAGDKSRMAVRDVRAGLEAKSASTNRFQSQFSIDILNRHAGLQRNTLIASVLIIAFAAWIVNFSLPQIFVGIWAGIAVALSSASLGAAWYFLKLEPEKVDTRKWRLIFQSIQGGKGMMWAALFAVHPIHDPNGSFSILAFSAAVVLTGLTLLSARNLKYGVLISAIPFIGVVTARLVMIGTPQSLAMALLVLMILMFFQRLGDMMRTSEIGFFKSRAERDQLIMELEASRGISEEARRRAEEANLAKSRFLATMSHELRTPLNAILGFSEVISNEVMGPLNNAHYKEYVGDIHRSGAHLLKLINEILDLSRVEAGRYKLHEEAVNLAHIAEESQQMIKLKASEKNVTLVMQIQPNLPNLWADTKAVRQVILNLLSNALKFTPPSGTIWMKVGWTASGGQYVSIKDTGPGIPAEEIPIVLSSFGQGSIAIKSAEQGTGLGLPIVQALVHMHDGTFDLKSKLREGTEVVATFPKARVLEPMAPIPQDAQQGTSMSQGLASFRRRKVEAPGM